VQPAYDIVLETPVGRTAIGVDRGSVNRIDFVADKLPLTRVAAGFGGQVRRELEQYFRNPRFRFSVAVAVEGTDFQQAVWQALEEIPCGAVVTYGELATRLGSSPRAVGNACRRNPVPIIVPCHRVVGASGPGGYTGQTAGLAVQRKQWLLAHEGVDLHALNLRSPTPK